MALSYSGEAPFIDVRRSFLEGAKVVVLEDLANAQHNMDLDVELGQLVARGAEPPLLRLWRAHPAPGIGVSRRDISGEHGPYAIERMQQEGAPLVLRQTGGTAVPQGPGVFHLSILVPRPRDRATTDDFYRLLCSLLLQWFSLYELSGTTGALNGSYCDGNYNILVGGKKLVGTAQAWRGGLAGVSSRQPGYVLAHACITVDVDFTWATRVINLFYELVGQDYRVQPNTSVSMKELLPTVLGESTPGDTTAWAMAQLKHHLEETLAR